jgi:hydrogenase nickel incorporation protein HypA/HybF
MHELSIAQSLLEIIEEEGKRHGLSRVVRIAVKIGTLSAIVPDALTFSFEAIRAGTIAEGANLDIEVVPAKGYCEECGADFRVESALFLCPRCGAVASEIISGKELEISQIEGEEAKGAD